MLGPQEISFRHFGDTSSSLWGGSILKSTWKEFENVQNKILTKYLQVKKQTPYTPLLLETISLPIEITTMVRVVEYMLKVQKCPPHRLPRIAWEASKKFQRRIKAKFCVLVGCKTWKNGLVDGMQHT